MLITKRKLKKSLCTIFFALSFCGSTNLCAAPPPLATPNEPWQIDIAPYLWAIGLKGTVQVGPGKFPVSENFGDILKDFNGGGMLLVDAHKGKFGLLFNGLYSVLSQAVTVDRLALDTTDKFGVFGAGVSYEILTKAFRDLSELGLEPYLGARYTLNDATVRVDGFSLSDNHHWCDPIVGARLRYQLNPQWNAWFTGDGGGINGHNSYNLVAAVGYHFESHFKNTTFYLGYRFLHQHYTSGTDLDYFAWNMDLFGPILGASIRF